MRCTSCLLLLALLTSTVAPPSFAADTWPNFRGTNASGASEDKAKLPIEIGPDKNVAWKVTLPSGHSSPVVAGNRVFVTSVDKEKRLLTIGIDRATGKVLWRAVAQYKELETVHAIGGQAQCSCATDGERVVSFFGSSGLYCYDADGKLLWKHRMGPFRDTYGAAASPLIIGDRVILNQDHDTDSFLAAYNKETGKVIWKVDRSEFPRGYSTPVLWNNKGKKQIVVVGAIRIIGYDLATGKEQWTVGGIARLTNATPAVGADGNLYVSQWAPGGDSNAVRFSADPPEKFFADFDANKDKVVVFDELPNGPLKARFPQIDRNKDGRITNVEYAWMAKIINAARNMFLAIKPGGEGDITETHVLWKRYKYLPYVPSPLYYRGNLFTVKNGGIVVSINAKTGETIKTARAPKTGQYYASPVAGDGKVYLLDERGGLTVLDAKGDWQVLHTADFNDDAYATPAIAGGRIYLRTWTTLYCFGLKK
jgi:outer membrane protein assembly factor BamB